jgi:tetratricopeptide (TPR) repeat protein
VDERQRWEALRAELRSAQAAYDAGDRETALHHVDAALAIDPDFLAAQCLRDRVLARAEPVAPVLAAHMARQAPAASALPERLVTGPPVSADGRALFEQRVKRRRVDRSVHAARAALQRRCLEDAVAALDEIIALDPDRPELGELTAQLTQVRRTADSSTPGPWIAAAAVFVIAVVGPWLPESKSLRAHPMVGSALLVSPLMPTVITTASTSTASTGEPEEPIDDPLPIASGATSSRAGIAATSVAMVNDELIIRQTLERYRTAYSGLDARSAQAVYPAVNQAALARAFDNLQSQTLAFDACDMQVGGWSATATCHGSTRYVPKIGDHALHTEPRVWSFTLSKNGDDWKIENARAEP